jgi:hypothetical protein
MKKVNDKWFECEDGHVTVGDNSKKKCDADMWQLYYTKGKRKASWKGEYKKDDKTCGKPIVDSGDLPSELDYFSIWDYRIMHAFLMHQKFDSHFMIGLQKAFSKLKEELNGPRKQ